MIALPYFPVRKVPRKWIVAKAGHVIKSNSGDAPFPLRLSDVFV